MLSDEVAKPALIVTGRPGAGLHGQDAAAGRPMGGSSPVGAMGSGFMPPARRPA
jgi:hypothetical protein